MQTQTDSTVADSKAPFTVTSNGYFAAWVGLFASAAALCDAANFSFSDATFSKGGKSANIGLLVSGFTVLLAVTIADGEKKSGMDDESVFGVVSSCLTVVACFALLCVSNLHPVLPKICAIVLALLWATTAFVLTFRNPFIVTGNGYFACWAAFYFACRLFTELVLNKTPEDDLEVHSAPLAPGPEEPPTQFSTFAPPSEHLPPAPLSDTI
jgi:hypothetical protein